MSDAPHDLPPVDKLVLALLLSAIRKGAAGIGIGPDPGAAEEAQVRFVFTSDDAAAPPTLVEEMRPPIILLAPIVRKLAALANLALPTTAEPSEGVLELEVGQHGHFRFALHLSASASGPSARLRRLTS